MPGAVASARWRASASRASMLLEHARCRRRSGLARRSAEKAPRAVSERPRGARVTCRAPAGRRLRGTTHRLFRGMWLGRCYAEGQIGAAKHCPAKGACGGRWRSGLRAVRAPRPDQCLDCIPGCPAAPAHRVPFCRRPDPRHASTCRCTLQSRQHCAIHEPKRDRSVTRADLARARELFSHAHASIRAITSTS
jgi:hypothetical protein